MSLCTVTDAFLAGRAAAGDEAAFAELARRYRPLIRELTQWAPPGAEVEDLRQEALLGLYAACRQYDPARGRFAGLANMNVRWRVGGARRATRALKQRVLSEAARNDDRSVTSLEERTAASEDADPALVVALRDDLRERAELTHRRRVDRRRRYSDEQIARALGLIAEGKTLKQAAFAVGAPPGQVARWAKRARQPRLAGRRRYTPAEIRRALGLVQGGASLRQAGAAVGASNATVLRWLRQAA